MKILKGSVTAPKGFLASGVHSGLKKNKEKLDLALIYSEVSCQAAGVFTRNKVKANPVLVDKHHLEDLRAQAIIVNSGNANACTGEAGLKNAYYMAQLAGNALGIPSSDVLVASTGVIGVPLKISCIEENINPLVKGLASNGHIYAREAIMTTDTIKKECAVSFKIGESTVTLGGMSKGSGMIHPNMGTMLGFITTDLNITGEMLQEALKEAVNKSFNRISVDGDESTNDSVLILANGLCNNSIIDEKNNDYYEFLDALNYVCVELAKKIAKDGEGANKLIECRVIGCECEDDGVKLAKSVVKSNLVKTAVFGSDANWGRILCALGYSGVDFKEEQVDVSFESSKGYIEVYKKGVPLEFSEEKAKKILEDNEITILVNMNQGSEKAFAFGCDLSYEYVRINGDYRT